MPNAKFCKKCQTLKNFAEFGKGRGRAVGLAYAIQFAGNTSVY